MQALITTYSKSKHYNPAEPDADLAGPERDEVGLVQAICVKAFLHTIIVFFHLDGFHP